MKGSAFLYARGFDTLTEVSTMYSPNRVIIHDFLTHDTVLCRSETSRKVGLRKK